MLVESDVLMNRGLFGAVILSVLLFGCSASSRIDPIITRPPLVEPLPLVVGVYFSPEFRGYRSKCDGWLCPEYDVGPPSVALFELMLAGLFKDVVVLDSMPLTYANLKVDGILVPAISHLHAYGVAAIDYRLTLYSPSGAEFGAWEVGGVATTGAVFVSGLLRQAMRDAAAKFVRGLAQEPVVKSWLKQAGIELPESVPGEESSRRDVGG